MKPTSLRSWVRPGLRVGLGVLWAATLCVAADAAPSPSNAIAPMDWLERMGNHFDANPETHIRKGSGWKPYNRLKWFYEQRMIDGQPVPIGARAKAIDETNRILRERGPGTRASWFSLGPTNFGGRMLDIEFDPNTPSTMYAGSAGGGLFKSVDSGLTWSPSSDETGSLAVNAVCVLPSNPSIVLIATGEATFNIDRIGGVGILRSTDAGATWGSTALSYPESSGHGFHAMEVNPLTGTILAAATDGVWRSSDDGVNWTQVRVDDDYYDVAFKPGSSTVCYTVKGSGSGRGMKISSDDGLTFTAGGGGGPTSFTIGKSKIAVTPADPSKLYVHFTHTSNYNSLGTYLSTNDGSSFVLQSTADIVADQGWYNLMFGADPNNANQLIGGGIGFSRSTNGGVNWSSIGGGVHVDHHAIEWKPGSPDVVWIGNDGGLYESVNDGGSWSVRNTNLVTYQFYDICVAQNTPSFIMGGTQDNGTDRWTGSTVWGDGLGADGMVCNINPATGTTVYAEIQFGDHRKSTNSGVSFFSINSGIPANNQQWVVPVAEDQLTPNHLYTQHSSGGIYRTTNGGTAWTNVSSHTATWIDISPVNGNYVFTVTTPMRFTTDDGANWQVASNYPFGTGGPTKVLADPVDVNTVYVTFSGYSTSISHVAKTTDLGTTWTDISGNLLGIPTNAIAVDDLDTQNIYVGTDVGVWATTDGGANWAPFEVGFPNTVVVDLEIQKSARKLVAGTHGRGAWEIDITAGPSTGVEVATPKPLNLMFDAPAPNPISRDTIFRFAAKSTSEVTLTVYDVNGRLVNEVVRAPHGDGIVRTAPWVADDVPSGVYFAVLKSGNDQISRKIVVAK